MRLAVPSTSTIGGPAHMPRTKAGRFISDRPEGVRIEPALLQLRGLRPYPARLAGTLQLRPYIGLGRSPHESLP